MPFRSPSGRRGGPAHLLQALGDRRLLRRFRAPPEERSLADLAALLPEARRLRAQADAVARGAERMMSARAGRIDLPPQADWGWRPEPWAVALRPDCWPGAAGGTPLAPGATLFHDCPLSEITLRQRRAADPQARAPFALAMDVLGFRGSFLSIVVDLPPAGRDGLSPSHIVGLRGRVTTERPGELFARLNVRHGPNTETIVRELRPGDTPGGAVEAEFDLGLEDFNPRKVTHAWVDVIFEQPAMTAATVHDLVLTRRPRANL
ncbi:DUF6478 family protein [Jannaschia sp. W003]|uniref:DUF6478 family protein n=1 Tax=Jannaschia sp. W003 TaxID=2867012 RepID=UPI0021A84E74|nr:DUF6478 family protein [Jannaschia sp. W003]UWQ21888.1 DUF6478 family protein [Jannaschia sp. W003]